MRNQLKEKEDNFTELLVTEQEISENQNSELVFLNFIKKLISLAEYIVTGILIGVAILSTLIFFKVRYDTLNIHFAKNLILTNLKNIEFSNASIGWDFNKNKFAVIINNALWKRKQIIIPELRLYPNLKDLLQLKLNIEKAAVINPKLEINFKENKILINRDFVTKLNNKKELLDLSIELPEIIGILTRFRKNLIDIQNATIAIKNNGFIICTASNANIVNNSEETSISASLNYNNQNSNISLKVPLKEQGHIELEFDNIQSKYLSSFIKLPQNLINTTIQGSVIFDNLSEWNLDKITSSGQFSLKCKDSLVTFNNLNYKINNLFLDGTFTDKVINIMNAKLLTGANTVICKNIEYYKNRNVINFRNNSSIKVNNCSLPYIASDVNIPFTVSNLLVNSGELAITGQLPLDKPSENNCRVYKYDLVFSNPIIEISNKYSMKAGNGEIKYENGKGNAILKNGEISGAKFKKINIEITNNNFHIKTNTNISAENIFNDSAVKKLPLFNLLEHPLGSFSGNLEFSIDRDTGYETIDRLEGYISLTDDIMRKHHFMINKAQINYSKGDIELSGFLKKNKTIPFLFKKQQNAPATLKLSGDLNNHELHLIGMPNNIMEGKINAVSKITFNDNFSTIESRADLKNCSIKLPIIGLIKKDKETGICKIKSIIRNLNIKNSFEIAMPEQSITGDFIADSEKIVNYNLSISSDSESRLNINGVYENEKWNVSCSGSSTLNLIKINNQILSNNNDINLTFNLSNGRLTDNIKFKKLSGKIDYTKSSILNAAINGIFSNNKKFSIQSAFDGEVISGKILSNDAGKILALLNINNEIKNGSIKVHFFSSNDRNQLNGRINISNFSINNRDSIHNILLLISPIGNSLSDTIVFNSLVTKFKKSGDIIKIRNGQAISPSVWLTFDGVYDPNLKNIKISGQAIPMHMYISQKQLWSSNYLITGNIQSPNIEASPLTEISKKHLFKIFDINQYDFIFNRS